MRADWNKLLGFFSTYSFLSDLREGAFKLLVLNDDVTTKTEEEPVLEERTLPYSTPLIFLVGPNMYYSIL